jgi:sugar phosphate isomerase/epimerase
MLLYTRREMAKLALAALPAMAFLNAQRLSAAAAPATPAAKPNSKINGVQLSCNVPYSFGPGNMTADEILASCVGLNLSSLELRAQPIEAFMGAPAPVDPARTGAARRAAATPEDRKAALALEKESNEQLRKWRATAPMSAAKAFRKKYEDAGVAIGILKLDRVFQLSDEELDYGFALAKAVGARAISTEISFDENELKRVGAFADKHKFWIAYHGHATTTPVMFEKAFAVAKYNGANVDLGHFVAGDNGSVVEFIKKHHERITHVHLKDRKKGNGPNMPFGQGDTPIVEVLKLIRDEKWHIDGTIEFEYKVPADSTRMAEIAKALNYCRAALA